MVAPQTHNRPHVLRHLFGLDGFGERRRERAERQASAHAAISYSTNDQRVTELPASLVYEKGSH
jgi:hypothetical protein